MLPPPTLCHAPNQELVDKNHQLETDLININKKYEDAINDCVKANQSIKSLEKHISEAEIKVEEARNTNEKLLLAEIKQLKIALAERDHEIFYLNKANVSAKEALEKLNKALHENSKKFKEEKAQLYKDNKAELKSWKKDLGDANSQILKLEKKIQVLVENHEVSVTQPSVSQPLFPGPGRADPSPTSPVTPPCVPPSTTQPSTPPAASDNASANPSCSAAVGPGRPFPPEPCEPRTQPDSPSCTGNSRQPSNSTKTISVQAKLKEVIASGEKLKYENLVTLLESHPWETETQEPFENGDDYADYYYEDFD